MESIKIKAVVVISDCRVARILEVFGPTSEDGDVFANVCTMLRQCLMRDIKDRHLKTDVVYDALPRWEIPDGISIIEGLLTLNWYKTIDGDWDEDVDFALESHRKITKHEFMVVSSGHPVFSQSDES